MPQITIRNCRSNMNKEGDIGQANNTLHCNESQNTLQNSVKFHTHLKRQTQYHSCSADYLNEVHTNQGMWSKL